MSVVPSGYLSRPASALTVVWQGRAQNWQLLQVLFFYAGRILIFSSFDTTVNFKVAFSALCSPTQFLRPCSNIWWKQRGFENSFSLLWLHVSSPPHHHSHMLQSSLQLLSIEGKNSWAYFSKVAHVKNTTCRNWWEHPCSHRQSWEQCMKDKHLKDRSRPELP